MQVGKDPRFFSFYLPDDFCFAAGKWRRDSNRAVMADVNIDPSLIAVLFKLKADISCRNMFMHRVKYIEATAPAASAAVS